MKVFISSVIEGFKEYRAAARRAANLLNLESVMAEDFPAQPLTPQQACLEGVRASDLYVGVLGARYGATGASGRAPTEEEFEEARRLSKPVLVFTWRGEMDETQQAFLDRIRSWDKGVLYARFGTPEELKDEIIRALALRTSPGQVITPDLASETIGGLFSTVDDVDGDVLLGLGLVPDLARPLVELSAIDELANQVSQAASTLPGFQSGFQSIAKERSAEAYIGDYRREAALEAFDDGRMICVLPLTSDRRDLASGFIIDARMTQSSLATMIGVFQTVLAWLDKRGMTSRVYLQGRLKGVRMKTFADVPSESINTIEIPSHSLLDPLPFPSAPLEVGRPQLAKAEDLAATLRSVIARLFESARQPRRA